MKTKSAKPTTPRLLSVLTVFSLLASTAPLSLSRAATYTWNGGGGSSDTAWASDGNWAGGSAAVSAGDTDIVFDLDSSASLLSNIGSAFTLHSITFTPSASAYHLTGEAITIQGNGEWGAAAIVSEGQTPTIDNQINLATGAAIQCARGDLTINGNINLGSNSLLLQTESGHTDALYGKISGTGWVLFNGTGTTVIGGNNDYTGPTINFNSTVLLKSSASDTGGAFGASTDAVRISGGSILTAAAVTVDKDIVFSTTEYSARTVGGSTAEVSNFTKTIYNGEASAAAAIVRVTAADGGRVNIANVSRASGATGSSDDLIKNGKGIVALTGANNNYQGQTQVNEGTLLVNGTITSGGGSVTVASGAALGGSGVIGRDVSIAGGASFNPGDVAADGSSLGGLLTINGALTLADTSIVNFDLGGSINDLVVVNGVLTLDGVLNVRNLGGLATGTYELFEYSGALNDYGLVVNPLPDGFTGTIVYADGVVSLSVVPEPSVCALSLLGLLGLLARRRRDFFVSSR